MQNPFDPGYYCSEELRGFGFKAVGENVRNSRACNIVGLENIEIGSNVRIDAFTSIVANNGWVRLGSYIHIGMNCLLGARGGIEFDDFSGISHGVKLLTATDDCSGEWLMSYEVPAKFTNPEVRPIRIGRHAVIGAMALPGATLAAGAVVGGMSLVKGALDPWALHAGIPTRPLRQRLRNSIELEKLIEAEHRKAA